jgi:hypothetical protein
MHGRRILALGPLLIPLAACFTFPAGDRSFTRQSVFISASGRALAPLADTAKRGKELLDSAARATYVQAIVDSIRASGQRRVLVFAHGGLVSLKTGLDKTIEGRDTISKAGFFPIFINWDAHWAGAPLDQLLHADAGSPWRTPWPLVPPRFAIYTIGHLGGAVFDIPRNLVAGLSEYRKSVFQARPRESEERQIDGLRVGVGRYYGRSFLQTAAEEAHTILVTPVRALVTGPLVDGFGTQAWDGLVQRSNSAFRPGDEYRAAFPEEGGAGAFRPPSGTAGVLIEALADLQRELDLEVVFIGHSMGALLGNQVLALSSLRPSRIVYMAAASSIDQTVASVVPYLRSNPDAQFHILTLHPNLEANETFWPALGLPPRGSLLHWIDATFADPRYFGERVIGRYDNIIKSLHLFPAEVRSRVTVKTFGRADVTDPSVVGYLEPRKHGDFSNPRSGFWREEFLLPVPAVERQEQREMMQQQRPVPPPD